MEFMNIQNIHDNSKAQIKVGLNDATKFEINNNGNKISIIDSANSVNTLQVGGTNGFNITYTGGKIVFSANSGESPLAIIEPNRGGVPGCAYLNCHQDKYSSEANAMIKSGLPAEMHCNADRELSNTLLNPNELQDGTMLMVMNHQWKEITIDDIAELVALKLKAKI